MLAKYLPPNGTALLVPFVRCLPCVPLVPCVLFAPFVPLEGMVYRLLCFHVLLFNYLVIPIKEGHLVIPIKNNYVVGIPPPKWYKVVVAVCAVSVVCAVSWHIVPPPLC